MKKIFLLLSIPCTSMTIQAMDDAILHELTQPPTEATRGMVRDALDYMSSQANGTTSQENNRLGMNPQASANDISPENVLLVDQKTCYLVKYNCIMATNSSVLLDALKKNNREIHLSTSNTAFLLSMLITFEASENLMYNYKVEEIAQACKNYIAKYVDENKTARIYGIMRWLAAQYKLTNVYKMLTGPEFNQYYALLRKHVKK